MPSVIYLPRYRANVKWDPDNECFQMWCPDCRGTGNSGTAWWPLTEEFWQKDNLQRCKACERKREADYIAKRRRDDPEFKKRQVAQSRAIRGFHEKVRS